MSNELETPDSEVLEAQGPGLRKAAAPTTRLTLALYRKLGFQCGVTEHWNAFAGIRQDLFGFCDLIAVDGNRVLFVQTTSWSNVSSRRRKIEANEVAALVARTPGAAVVIMGWRKKGNRWEHKEEEYKPCP